MRRLSLVLLTAVLVLVTTVFALPAGIATAQPIRDTGRVIVRFNDSVAPHDKAAHHAEHRGVKIKHIPELNIDVVSIPDPRTTTQVAASYATSPSVRYAEVDALMPPAVTTTLTPNDPFYPYQWYHHTIHSPEAWTMTTGLPTTRITVCDSGISPTHPDLSLLLRADLGYNTASNLPGHWEPVFWHGTAVAGTAVAIGNNYIGVAGVSWASEIVPVRITNRFDARAYVSDMMACLVYGATVSSDVINLSYITYDGGGIFPGIILAADYANNAGSVVVIAAGNDSINPAPTQDPDSILYVAATTSSNTPASFSNYGTYVDIAAPGVSITTTYSAVSCTDFNNNGMADPGECVVTSNGYASAFGTSFSAPLVAGGVLLLRSVTPSLPPASTRALLCQFATDLGSTGEDQTYGCGLLNLQAALQLTQAPVSTLTVTTPNGGESWRIGSKQEIRWTTGGLDSKVRIELSRDTGASWTTLTQNTANNGLWRWQVTKPSTTQGLIRVTNLTNPAASDVTDAPFAITQ